VVQVNGKVRATIKVPADADRDSIQTAALANGQVLKFIGDHAVRKVILVPGRLVNIVV
jgi:leucyl-tRNA synthetase